MHSLTSFIKGDTVLIEQVHCGIMLHRRLAELGLYCGAHVRIIKNDYSGPIILGIQQSHIALGRGEAAKIYGTKQ